MMMKLFYIPVLACLTLFSCTINQLGGNNNPSGGGGSSSSAPIELYGVFVSTNGSDTNSGTNAASPLRSLPIGISNAIANGVTNIYISAGTYKPGLGLNLKTNGLVITNSGLNFSGGWDSNFQNCNGYSVLDGTNGLDHVVYAKNVNNMLMQGLIIRNGFAAGNDAANTNGAGMYLTNLNSCLLTNIIVCSNYALGNGGGIWFCGVSNTFSIGIFSNINVFVSASYGYGGGIFIGQGSRFNTFRGDVSYNSAASGGGMYFDTNSGNNEISCSIEKNVSAWVGGGGIVFNYSDSNHFQGLVNGNTVNFAAGPWCLGGGVMIYYGCWNLVEGNVCSNTGYSGSGGCIWYGSNNTIRAFVYDNVDAGYGGGFFLWHSDNVVVSGIILRNQGRWNCGSGGLAIYYSSTTILTNLIVTGNSCGGGGFGVLGFSSVIVTNGSYIYNNYPNDCGY
jgi:hypothetical protein